MRDLGKRLDYRVLRAMEYDERCPRCFLHDRRRRLRPEWHGLPRDRIWKGDMREIESHSHNMIGAGRHLVKNAANKAQERRPSNNVKYSSVVHVAACRVSAIDALGDQLRNGVNISGAERRSRGQDDDSLGDTLGVGQCAP